VNDPDGARVELIELPGSHSPFLSQPAALACLMQELTHASAHA
jgi:hypothetical protein